MSSTVLGRDAGPYSDVALYASEFEQWLATEPQALMAATEPEASLDAQMASMRHLMGALYLERWSRYGWPEAVGGLGGSIYHRAVIKNVSR